MRSLYAYASEIQPDIRLKSRICHTPVVFRRNFAVTFGVKNWNDGAIYQVVKIWWYEDMTTLHLFRHSANCCTTHRVCRASRGTINSGFWASYTLSRSLGCERLFSLLPYIYKPAPCTRNLYATMQILISAKNGKLYTLNFSKVRCFLSATERRNHNKLLCAWCGDR